MNAVVREIFNPSVNHAHLLVDGKGPYGLCVESDPEDRRTWLGPSSVIVRADYIEPSSHLPTLFQLMPHGRPRWAEGNEDSLIYRLRELMLADRGINRTDKPDAKYWRQWHGLRRAATRVINSLLVELYATIPTERLRIIRRYPISLRSSLYRGLCGASDRAWQLADTFPWLALVVYDPRVSEPVDKARTLVDRGAKLRDVARAVDRVRVPMALCRFKPAVMRQALRLSNFLLDHPNLVAHHCPETVPRQRAWLSAIAQATSPDEEFATWVASHYEQIGKWREVPAIVGDVRDWVRATHEAKVVGSIKPAELECISAAMVATGFRQGAMSVSNWWESVNKNCVGRTFDKRMALHTVLRMSHEWHERAAKAQAANLPFPHPWYDGDTINGHCIVPIKNAVELSRHSYELHNCASQYSQAIANGDCFVYIVSNGDGKSIAMAEIARAEKPMLRQLKGPCNQAVAKPVQNAVRTWLTRQKRNYGAGRMPARIANIGTSFANDDFDQDIPF